MGTADVVGAGNARIGCIEPVDVTLSPSLDDLLRQTPRPSQQAYSRPTPASEALAKLVSCLPQHGWFTAPVGETVMGYEFTRLVVKGDCGVTAVANFIIALTEHLEGAKQVAWREKPVLLDSSKGASVRAEFVVWKGN